MFFQAQQEDKFRFIITKKKLSLLIVAAAILLTHGGAEAQSNYEFYFFGVNLKSFRECNWTKVTAGAVVSVLVHELGHALYLQSQAKEWELQTSLSSGMGIHTDDSLSDQQCRDFGRAGFALQTALGTILTSLDKTRDSDFTKGWVGMTEIQVFSYKGRRHDIGDDFAMMERGGGGDFELGVFVTINSYNLLKAGLPTTNGLSGTQGFWECLSRQISSPQEMELDIKQVEGLPLK